LADQLQPFTFVKRVSLIRVIIFEDNRHLRETLELLINNTPGFDCAGSFEDCDDLKAILDTYPCDVILMDIEMPGMNGIEATKLIKKLHPDVQILIQTVFFEDNYIFDAICAGASGYILKSTSPQGYIDAIKDVKDGGSPMTPGIARQVLALFKTNLQATPESVDYHLTAQEKKVLQLLVEGKSYKMIAAAQFVSTETIKSQVSSIYAKLHVHSGTEAVAKALRDKIV
jgi:DNA-binding NarL/FixJ family response regulator